MPVKMWDRDERGRYTSRIETNLNTGLGGEEYRAEAEELDQRIDIVLERTVQLLPETPLDRGKSQEFAKRWAIGRAIAESDIHRSSQIVSEPNLHPLWRAMAIKCRLGIRSTGAIEDRWSTLIPFRESEPERIERDIFALGLWLQEQELNDAQDAFGGKLGNAREIHRREALRSINMRNALARRFRGLDAEQRSQLLRTKEFALIAKALQRRWPSRGPGSAKRPAHFADDDLDRELGRVLDGLALPKK